MVGLLCLLPTQFHCTWQRVCRCVDEVGGLVVETADQPGDVDAEPGILEVLVVEQRKGVRLDIIVDDEILPCEPDAVLRQVGKAEGRGG